MTIQTMLQNLIAVSEGSFAAAIIKATAAVVLALVLLRVTRRASASMRHLLAATTFVVLLLLPLVSTLMPKRVITAPATATESQASERQAILPVAAPEQTSAGQAGVPVLHRATNYAAIAFRIYLGGVALFALTLAGGLWRVRRMRERAEVSVAGTRMAKI